MLESLSSFARVELFSVGRLWRREKGETEKVSNDPNKEDSRVAKEVLTIVDSRERYGSEKKLS